MNRRGVQFWLAILLAFCGSMLIWFAGRWNDSRQAGAEETSPVQMQSHTDQEPPVVEASWVDFELTDQYGRPFSSEQLKGKVWVGGVFYTTCTSVCRAQNQQMAKIQSRFGDQGVELVALTCDPDRDTPQTLAEYGRLFNAEKDVWHFLTGDFETIQQIGWNMFRLPVERSVHSDRLVVFDREGNSRGAFRSIDVNEFEKLIAVVDELVAEENADLPKDEE